MINKIVKKLAEYYIRCYKKQLMNGKEPTVEEDKLFAYCVLEINNERE